MKICVKKSDIAEQNKGISLDKYHITQVFSVFFFSGYSAYSTV